MPVPHLNIRIVQRSKGNSAVAGAAYQAGEKLFSEYDQKHKDHRRKQHEVVYTEIMLPTNAPPEYADRATLWNSAEEVEKQWDLYNKWLSATLNKKLMLIELGEGFLIPNLIRWPFEKVTFINQKSVLYRINGQLPQLPENISERAAAVSESSHDFLQELKNFLAQ